MRRKWSCSGSGVLGVESLAGEVGEDLGVPDEFGLGQVMVADEGEDGGL